MGENNSQWSNWQRISKIYKQHMQLNTRKINDPIKKLTKELRDHFTIHTGVESLCHLPRSNIVLEVTYALIIMWISEFVSDQFSSVTQSCPTPCNPMDCRTPCFPCPSQTPRACSNSCPLIQWFYRAISPSVIPFSSCLQSFPTWGSFPMSQFFTSGSQSIGASALASVFQINIQDWFAKID